ncbi:hypothetical protein [Leifsonia sp. NPDC058248]|uniref:hypothetical protein n=1 Tax=Leifsonia sp. NPDC058248 TaxID=3346402 RepID=UPI0036DF0AE9
MHHTESDFPSENDSAQVGRYLEAWITGRPLGDVRAMAFVAESGLVQSALALLGKDDIAIVPAGSDIRGFPGKTVEYLGRFVDVGDEMTIDGRSIEMQDYLMVKF